MGGRGAGSSIPTATPGGGGGGKPMDAMPGNPDTLKEALGTKGRPMSMANAVLGANPFYDNSYGDYSENCQRAVIATEARLRGYNVIASPTYKDDPLPWGNNFATHNFKNAQVKNIGKTTPQATQNAVEKQMAEYGNGSRAILAVQWKGRNAGGHVLNVVQRNGKTYYVDGQVGKQYTGKELFSAIKKGNSNTKLVRVDNLEFSDGARESVRQNPNRK